MRRCAFRLKGARQAFYGACANFRGNRAPELGETSPAATSEGSGMTRRNGAKPGHVRRCSLHCLHDGSGGMIATAVPWQASAVVRKTPVPCRHAPNVATRLPLSSSPSMSSMLWPVAFALLALVRIAAAAPTELPTYRIAFDAQMTRADVQTLPRPGPFSRGVFSGFAARDAFLKRHAPRGHGQARYDRIAVARGAVACGRMSRLQR